MLVAIDKPLVRVSAHEAMERHLEEIHRRLDQFETELEAYAAGQCTTPSPAVPSATLFVLSSPPHG
ncbi:MAG TPA: hypothetical protein VMU19_07070 [Bryobacteraceae bacterium]|nr:hypothetical protein [Bryobacteraceae bacterium]